MICSGILHVYHAILQKNWVLKLQRVLHMNPEIPGGVKSSWVHVWVPQDLHLLIFSKDYSLFSKGIPVSFLTTPKIISVESSESAVLFCMCLLEGGPQIKRKANRFLLI